ncbi:MAG: 50S ribosome-binding GTPase, partial [Thiomargarita sp.]|nr:50S ribosome-binding GTPase [Thiomargarita sp.]
MAQYSTQETQDITILKKELYHTIDNDVLQIMLYGAYNAGKSTLINALLGRDAAKVKDIPTTFKVDQYDWNGYHLMDTPGVNAPDEHEKATEAQVKRSGIMIFVIRAGDQDSKDLYHRLFKLLKRDKKVFIVLNHQLVDQKDKILALKKINDHLYTLAPEYSVKESDITQISILPVNLRSACKAYSNAKHKDKFLEHSGFNDFLQNVTQWIRTQDTQQGHIEILQKQIDECWYQPVLKVLQKSDANTSKSTELTTLSNATSLLESEKRLLILSSTSYIAQQINLRKSNIQQVLQNSQSQADLDSNLQNIFLPVTSEIEQWLSEQLKTLNSKLAMSIQHEHSQNSEPNQGKWQDFVAGFSKKFGEQDNFKQVLLLGRKFKVPFLKGRWESTL